MNMFEAYCEQAASHLVKAIGMADLTETGERLHTELLYASDKSQEASSADG
jgi:hypothetical protein